MTVLLGLLLTGVVFGLASAISGIESIHTDPQGTIITYWHGYGRLLALAYAAAFAITFYGVYGRYPLVWKLGFVFWYLGAAQFIFQAWWMLWPQPYGWVGATAVTVFTPFVTLYWVSWWRRQKGWFFRYGYEET